MKTTKIGSIALGKVPRVVAIIDNVMDMSRIANLKRIGVDILEIRADLLALDTASLCSFISAIKKETGFACIATLRETQKNKDNRTDIFKSIIPLVDAIDIEIDSKINRQVIALAKKITVIVSEHDFEKTPATSSLQKLVDKADSMGADIIKLATMAKSSEDVARLMAFTSATKKNLVTIAMGDFGKVSRVIAPLFGSLFTYGFVTKAVAPGQIPVEELIEEMKKYYPEFGRK